MGTGSPHLPDTPQEHHVHISASLPISVRDIVLQLANEWDVAFGVAAGELIRQGITHTKECMERA